MAVIEVRGLRKEYRRFKRGHVKSTLALDGLDLVVPDGGVFGFLGPNGSGKTTTIRCLLGLIAPTQGTCRLLGADATRDLATVLPRVGSIVEAPALFPNFSGRRNLQLLAGIQGIGKNAIDDVLERVGLAGRDDDRVKTYSLGMRQRRGIAAALLKDPQVLILDEPANGLDPAGIKEVRDLVRGLGSEGRTVFVSSHILSEVRQMCDHVAILARGKSVAAGSVDEVLGSTKARSILVRVDDLDRASEVLRAAGIQSTVADGRLEVTAASDKASEVNRVLAQNGLYASEIRAEEIDLESVFLELTREPEAAP